MKKTQFTKLLSFVLCLVLVAAMALCTIGCESNKDPEQSQSGVQTDNLEVRGQGETKFTFTVIDADGNDVSYEIHTDKTTVGAALLELELIAGEDSAYGLYVKTVNGITADYDTDGTYWAFYINGEYAMSGVDTTDITDGAVYTFKVE